MNWPRSIPDYRFDSVSQKSRGVPAPKPRAEDGPALRALRNNCCPNSPSPCTQGEGRGGGPSSAFPGQSAVEGSVQNSLFNKSPLPTPPPEYKGRETLQATLSQSLRFARSAIFNIAFVSGLIASIFRKYKRRILILRTDGLGDGVLSEPFIRAIAKRYRDAEIHLWAPAATCELFASAKYVQVCQIIPRGFKAGCLEYFHTTSWRWKLGFLFGSQRYEIAIYPAISAEPLGNWIFRSVRAQKRWAVEGDLFHQFPRQRYAALKRATRILARPKEIHELERNADLARQCGASDVNTLPQISLDAAANENSARLLSSWRELAESRGASGLLGVVSSASMAKFSWPAENWRTALQQIWREHRLMPVLLSQNAICDPAIPHAVLNESIDVRTLSAILGQIDMVLSLDTGPAHISAAMRTPTVVLSNDGHPGRFFPWPDALWVKSLVHSMPCAGCVCKCPLAEAECLTRIKVADVLIAVGELRKSSFAEAA